MPLPGFERRPPHRLRAGHLAGWLFADLFLALLVVALVTAVPRTGNGTTPTTSSRPAPTTSSTPPGRGACPQEGCLRLEPHRFTLDVPYTALRAGGPGADEVVRQMRRKLAAAGLGQRRAGFLLTFGSAPNAERATGIAMANKVNAVLKRRLALFSKAQGRGYWTEGPLDHLQIDVFFFA